MHSARGVSRIALFAIVVFFIAAGPAGAATLFSTFGPGDSYAAGGGIGIGGFMGSPPNWSLAAEFSFAGTQSYLFDSAEVAIGVFGGNEPLYLSLASDAAGKPGAPLETITVPGPLLPFDGHLYPPVLGASATHPLLTPGTNYWLIAAAPVSAMDVWFGSNPTVFGAFAESADGGPWSVTNPEQLPGFRINGTPVGSPVPVPGALLLAASGAGLVGYLRRRQTL